MKITLSTFALFFIYGLVSVFYVGKFASPVFLNQLVVLGFSVLFFVLNRKEHQSWILALFAVAQFFSCMVDGFTVSYLAQKFETDVFLKMYESLFFGIGFILIYFGFFLFLNLFIHKYHGNKLITIVLTLLVPLVVYLLLFEDAVAVRDITFAIYIILFATTVHKFFKTERPTFQVLSYLLLLLVMLEGLEYFQ